MNARILKKADFAQRFAILIGSFSGGFDIATIKLGKEEAQNHVDTILAAGQLAEAVPVLWPSDLDSSLDDAEHMDGIKYLVLATEGINPARTFVGPFAADEFGTIDEVGDTFRPEDGEYGEFEVRSGIKMPELLNAVLYKLVDDVVDELRPAWPLLTDPAIVAAFKELIERRFTAKEDSQTAFEAILSFIEGQAMEGGITVDEIQSQVRSYDTGEHSPEPTEI